MTSPAHTAAIDNGGHPAASAARCHSDGRLTATDRQAAYPALMRKRWFTAAVVAPSVIRSYPRLLPGRGDFGKPPPLPTRTVVPEFMPDNAGNHELARLLAIPPGGMIEEAV